MTEFLFENGTDTLLFENGVDQLIFDEWPTYDATLGTVTDTGSATVPSGWSSARALTITIPEVTTEHATVEIALRNMTGTAGLIFLHVGGDLPGYWDDGTQATFIAALVSDGYRIVQFQSLTHYWMAAPSGQKPGPAALSKRGAGLIKYVHDTYSDGLPFIVIAGSAGSSILSYALVFNGLSSIIDHAIHDASVPHADIYRSCAQAVGDEKYWSGDPTSANLVDISYGYAGDNTGPCYLGNPSVDGALWGASSLVRRPVGYYQWPNTRVDLLNGSDDIMATLALLYHERLNDASQPHRVGLLPHTSHPGVRTSDKGQQTMLAALRRKPYMGAWAENSTDAGTSLTATLDIPAATGELIVAVRQWNGDATVGTTPTGWARVAVATTTGASPRTVAIETKTADGTEGTALTFATTGTTVQSLAATVVVNSMNPQLTDSSSQTLTGTSMTLSAAAAQDTISFGAIAVEETGTNAFNQAWTNDFDQFSGTSEVLSSAYAIHGSAGTKTTVETWVQSVAAAGVTATFSAVGPYEVLTPTSRYY